MLNAGVVKRLIGPIRPTLNGLKYEMADKLPILADVKKTDFILR